MTKYEVALELTKSAMEHGALKFNYSASEPEKTNKSNSEEICKFYKKALSLFEQ